MKKKKSRTDQLAKISMSTALVASTLTIMTPQAEANQFSDVDEKSSHAANIYALANQGAIHGYPDGTFKPNAHVTRGQAAKMIANALGLQATSTAPTFEDVPSTHQYYTHISALAEAGIINGDNGNYHPNASLTRGQMAKIIARAFELELGGEHLFSDVPKNHEFAPYINTLAQFDITTGKTETTFAMGDFVTRAQISSFIVRAQQATTKDRIEGTIEAISADGVTINGKTYSVGEAASFLQAAQNEDALNGATVQVVIEKNEIQRVVVLSLTQGTTFDGQGAVVEQFNAPTTLTTLKNITATTVHQKISNQGVTYEKVVAQNATLDVVNVAVASTSALVWQQQRLNLIDSQLTDVTFQGQQIDVALDGESSIENLRALLASFLKLNGDFQNVYVGQNLQINGMGKVEQLISNGATGELTTVNTGLTIRFVTINGTEYTWQQAVAQFGFNNGSTTSNRPPVNNIVGGTSNGNTGGGLSNVGSTPNSNDSSAGGQQTDSGNEPEQPGEGGSDPGTDPEQPGEG
ncbi:S-layer homology domain-containing protein, partial [Caryophanon latum]|uniref:S-layer homology domain-containing protein n=1 Tax=Caryophanon latum TaxID=33977 RepID=UPI001112AE53